MIRHSSRIISRKNTRTLYIHVWCSLFNISPLRQRRMESDAEDRCRYGRCRRNHSRKMPFRSKFCYISNSSYICIAVPGVPLSDVSADDESGFFLFTNLISFATTKIRIGRGPRCRYGRCRRNFSPLHRFASLDLKSRITAAPRAFPGKPCGDSQVYPLKSRIAARQRAIPGIPCSDSQV